MSAPDSREERVVSLLTTLAVGVTTRRLYSAEHPRYLAARNQLVELLEALLSSEQELTLFCLEDELFVDGAPLRQTSGQVGTVIRELRHRDVEGISFLEGVAETELEGFLSGLADRRLESLEGSRHIRMRSLAPQSSQLYPGVPRDSQSALRAVMRDRVRLLHDAFLECRAGQQLAVAVLSDVVAAIDSEVEACVSPLALLVALEEEELWPAVHAHNVAVLASSLAHLLGLGETEREEIGLAAVLHDLGKVLGDPNEVRRELRHSGPELELDPDHPRRGYEALIQVSTLPAVVPVVAIEHHLGRVRGGYPKLPRKHSIHPVSAMIAAGETFDVLHTVRAPAGLISREGIIASLYDQARAGLDPLFVQLLEGLILLEEVDGSSSGSTATHRTVRSDA